jgi:hypothetical protein
MFHLLARTLTRQAETMRAQEEALRKQQEADKLVSGRTSNAPSFEPTDFECAHRPRLTPAQSIDRRKAILEEKRRLLEGVILGCCTLLLCKKKNPPAPCCQESFLSTSKGLTRSRRD